MATKIIFGSKPVIRVQSYTQSVSLENLEESYSLIQARLRLMGNIPDEAVVSTTTNVDFTSQEWTFTWWEVTLP